MPHAPPPPRALCVTLQDMTRAAAFLRKAWAEGWERDEAVWKLARAYARTHYTSTECEMHREQKRIRVIGIEELLRNIHPRTFQWKRPGPVPRVSSSNKPSL